MEKLWENDIRDYVTFNMTFSGSLEADMPWNWTVSLNSTLTIPDLNELELISERWFQRREKLSYGEYHLEYPSSPTSTTCSLHPHEGICRSIRTEQKPEHFKNVYRRNSYNFLLGESFSWVLYRVCWNSNSKVKRWK